MPQIPTPSSPGDMANRDILERLHKAVASHPHTIAQELENFDTMKTNTVSREEFRAICARHVQILTDEQVSPVQPQAGGAVPPPCALSGTQDPGRGGSPCPGCCCSPPSPCHSWGCRSLCWAHAHWGASLLCTGWTQAITVWVPAPRHRTPEGLPRSSLPCGPAGLLQLGVSGHLLPWVSWAFMACQGKSTSQQTPSRGLWREHLSLVDARWLSSQTSQCHRPHTLGLPFSPKPSCASPLQPQDSDIK
ncbi:Hypothetical predicted protein [Marmota monax]|uniref:DJBP EF-hand domain-containing protein n=1 Tax=Marmota monax TaxID=9995 RepID=A0A5E4CL32_MARMO|nr:Hypothetical predicted protein [Marmota monax]